MQVSSEIPITYIDENSIPEDSVIILTTEDMEELSLEKGAQIIVNRVRAILYAYGDFAKSRSDDRR